MSKSSLFVRHVENRSFFGGNEVRKISLKIGRGTKRVEEKGEEGSYV